MASVGQTDGLRNSVRPCGGGHTQYTFYFMDMRRDNLAFG
jgi:hypothetical protein